LTITAFQNVYQSFNASWTVKRHSIHPTVFASDCTMTAGRVGALVAICLAVAILLFAFSTPGVFAAEEPTGPARHGKPGFKDAGTKAETISNVASLDEAA
jgi:hypothetical protein